MAVLRIVLLNMVGNALEDPVNKLMFVERSAEIPSGCNLATEQLEVCAMTGKF